MRKFTLLSVSTYAFTGKGKTPTNKFCILDSDEDDATALDTEPKTDGQFF